MKGRIDDNCYCRNNRHCGPLRTQNHWRPSQCRHGFSMVTMCFLPKVLYGSTLADLTRSGIAGSEPRLMTYTVAIAVIVLMGVVAGKFSRSNLLLLPFVAFLIICFVFIWTPTGEVQAGMVHFLTAAAAWAAGSYAASCVDQDGKTGRTFMYWILGTVVVQLGISLLQFAGLPLFPTNAATAELVGSRINGSFGHPTTLGEDLAPLRYGQPALHEVKDAADPRSCMGCHFGFDANVCDVRRASELFFGCRHYSHLDAFVAPAVRLWEVSLRSR